MALIFSMLNQADFNLGTVTNTLGNTIAFNASSAIGRQAGSAIITLPGGNVGLAYNERSFAYPSSNILRSVSYVDFTGLTMSDGEAFNVLHPRGAASANVLTRVFFRRAGASHYLDVIAYGEGGVFRPANVTEVGKSLIKLELESRRSSVFGATDARVRVWVNDVLVISETGFANFTSAGGVDRFRFGNTAELDTGTSGVLRIGDFQLYDTEGPTTAGGLVRRQNNWNNHGWHRSFS